MRVALGRRAAPPASRLYVSFVWTYRRWVADLAVHLDPDDVSSQDAERIAAELVATDTLTVGEVTVPLSPRARAALSQVFGHLAAGSSVDVVPVTEWLTTSEAAAMLHVSRPTLVQMLESGLIPFDQPAGVHRRVSRAAVDAFSRERRGRRRAALDELAQAEDPALADEFVETR